jgi:dihydrofolate reductase
MITIIAALGLLGEVGLNGALPWHEPEDLRHFRKVTTGNTVVMGRKTFESLGKPLPKRRNVVITSNTLRQHEGVEFYTSLYKFFENIGDKEVFIIGGNTLFNQCEPIADRMILTYIMGTFDADTYWQPSIGNWKMVEEQYVTGENHSMYITTYEKRR